MAGGKAPLPPRSRSRRRKRRRMSRGRPLETEPGGGETSPGQARPRGAALPALRTSRRRLASCRVRSTLNRTGPLALSATPSTSSQPAQRSTVTSDGRGEGGRVSDLAREGERQPSARPPHSWRAPAHLLRLGGDLLRLLGRRRFLLQPPLHPRGGGECRGARRRCSRLEKRVHAHLAAARAGLFQLCNATLDTLGVEALQGGGWRAARGTMTGAANVRPPRMRRWRPALAFSVTKKFMMPSSSGSDHFSSMVSGSVTSGARKSS